MFSLFRQFAVADRLIDFAEQVAAENGITTLQIELTPSEEAIINAYKNWGFDERPVVTLQKAVGASSTASDPAERKHLQTNPLRQKRIQQKILN